jgi:hypothetical protein
MGYFKIGSCKLFPQASFELPKYKFNDVTFMILNINKTLLLFMLYISLTLLFFFLLGKSSLKAMKSFILGETLQNPGMGKDFLDKIPRAQETKAKTSKQNYIKLVFFYTGKE